jgi:hypothetical protein
MTFGELGVGRIQDGGFQFSRRVQAASKRGGRFTAHLIRSRFRTKR